MKQKHQQFFKIGSRYKDVSDSSLSENIFTIDKCVDPESPTKEIGIALVNSRGQNFSHIIHKGMSDGITVINHDEFRIITSNTHNDFIAIES